MRPAGWYPDPEDPSRLRYFDGQAWSGRYRLRPPWSVWSAPLTPERPTGPGDDGGGSLRPAQMLVRTSRRPPDRAAGLPPRQRGAAGLTGLDRWPDAALQSGVPAMTSRTNRRLYVFAVLVAVSVILLTVTVGVARPQGPYSSVDSAFAVRANPLCAATLGANVAPSGVTGASLGSGAVGADTAPRLETAGSIATQMESAASRIDKLADEMRALPAAAGTSGDVARWLAAWHRYAGDERRLASMRVAGTTGRPLQELTDQAHAEGQRADDYAVTTGLQACTLLTPAAGSSLVAVP